MKASGKTIRRPPPLQRLAMSLRMLTMMEPNDGIKFEFMAPVSPKLQIGGGWLFSNSKPAKFELNTTLTSATSQEQMMRSQDEMCFISTRTDTTGKLEMNGSYKLGSGYSINTEGFFMDSDTNKAHVTLELMKEFVDAHISYKVGAGSHQFSWMQTLNQNLMGGFEMYYIPHTKDIHFCYAGNYSKDEHNFYGSYMPIARKETISFGYIGKPSKRLTLFTELKGSMEGFSDTVLGFRMRFMEGMLTGTFSSSLKATSMYKHSVENLLMLQFSSQLDFQNPQKPSMFGVALSIGGM